MCLVAPLLCDSELVAVINLTGRAHGALVEDSLPLDSIFAFLGRALHFARSYTHAQTEARGDCLTEQHPITWDSLRTSLQQFDTLLLVHAQVIPVTTV